MPSSVAADSREIQSSGHKRGGHGPDTTQRSLVPGVDRPGHPCRRWGPTCRHLSVLRTAAGGSDGVTCKVGLSGSLSPVSSCFLDQLAGIIRKIRPFEGLSLRRLAEVRRPSSLSNFRPLRAGPACGSCEFALDWLAIGRCFLLSPRRLRSADEEKSKLQTEIASKTTVAATAARKAKRANTTLAAHRPSRRLQLQSNLVYASHDTGHA